MQKFVEEQNTYLAELPRASEPVARRKVQQKWKKLRLTGVEITCDNRILSRSKKEDEWNKEAKLEGCDGLKTNPTGQLASQKSVYDRCKNFSQVDWAFRITKTIQLKAHSIDVRKESRSHGHRFFMIVACRFVQEFADCGKKIDATIEERIKELATLWTTRVLVKEPQVLHNVVVLCPSGRRFLKTAQVQMATKIASCGSTASAQEKLVEERKIA